MLKVAAAHEDAGLTEVVVHRREFVGHVIQVQQGRADGHALSDVGPGLLADGSDDIEGDLDGFTVPVVDVIAVDLEAVGLGIGSDFRIQGRVVLTGKEHDLLAGLTKLQPDGAVDGAICDRVSDPRCIGSGGDSGVLGHRGSLGR